ncbi:hypothetical protein [Paenibacillus sp. GSMTC-2017]|uniref:hypothetical protein n=1 Tax=Paenibacillus sp. GSMTC-2017 TaxID=2794350 RepID=UPI0018D6AE75|nr:hypothetical protein [Paenibacillus sp. GSMTC-2017]
MNYIILVIAATAAFSLDRPLLKNKRLVVAYTVILIAAISASFVVMTNSHLIGPPQLIAKLMDPLANWVYRLHE